jgi:hypothetical protein
VARTWLIFREVTALLPAAALDACSDERNGETHQRDAADQQAATPMLQHISVSGKNIRGRGRERANAETSPTYDQQAMNHLRPRIGLRRDYRSRYARME